ncbi:uncharacterized protein SCHCODRAFT_01207543 [Schizophyllum commune H4-8]|nr:uncharacterized protein SCHCODRAFT_01207543 [Schizophyllum commune H4-8]KAI5893062.1 hypothetical protein SCHCODRAFT_01207543 [Schizophyllum commune H4-8]
MSHTALRSLWKTVHSPAVIAKYTMPDDLWVITKSEPSSEDSDSDSESDELTPTRPIVEEDLKRFNLYAPLVRRMNFGWGGDFALCDDGHTALIAACRAPVFPNLTHMGWSVDCVGLVFSQHFVCPSITSMHILAEAPLTMGDVAILRNIQRQCPAVTQLRVQMDDASDALANVLSETICGWDLRALKTTHLSQKGLARLASSPNLEELEASNDEDQCHISQPVDFTPRSFATLTSFALGLPISFAACIDMLRSASFAHLRTLALFGLTPEPALWGALFTAIRAAHTRPHLLRRLILKDHILDSDLAPKGPEPEDASESRFAPLCEFSNLEEVHLNAQEGFRLSTNIIQGMAQAWPELRELRIVHRDCLDEPQLPLSALAHLAIHCARLEILEIDVDATGNCVPHDGPLPTAPQGEDTSHGAPSPQGASQTQDAPNPHSAPKPRPRPQTALHTLQLNWSPIRSARPVAAYLSMLFLDIRTLLSVCRDEVALSTVPEPRWQKVAHLLPAFNAVRDYVLDPEGGRWKRVCDDDGAED